MLVGDIAEMYTALPHTAIDEAISWLLKQPQRRGRSTRGKIISVHRRSRDIHMGRANGPGYAEIAFNTLAEVAQFDNQHMYVIIEGKVRKQRHGAPMGSNIAPGKATAT